VKTLAFVAVLNQARGFLFELLGVDRFFVALASCSPSVEYIPSLTTPLNRGKVSVSS